MSVATAPSFGSLVRILLLTIVFGGVVSLCIWFAILDRERALRAEMAMLQQQMDAEIETRDAMIERLGRTSRVARIEILDQTTDADGEILGTDVRFVEVDEHGTELGRRDYTIPGDVLFVDAWTVRFAQEQVAQGDAFAGRSLILLRRLYSDRMSPRDGLLIDTPGGIPDGYALTDKARFERTIWESFWKLATDADEARRWGVRVAQGEAVYKPVRRGQIFDLIAEASGGLTMTPVSEEDTQVAAVEPLSE